MKKSQPDKKRKQSISTKGKKPAAGGAAKKKPGKSESFMQERKQLGKSASRISDVSHLQAEDPVVKKGGSAEEQKVADDNQSLAKAAQGEDSHDLQIELNIEPNQNIEEQESPAKEEALPGVADNKQEEALPDDAKSRRDSQIDQGIVQNFFAGGGIDNFGSEDVLEEEQPPGEASEQKEADPGEEQQELPAEGEPGYSQQEMAGTAEAVQQDHEVDVDKEDVEQQMEEILQEHLEGQLPDEAVRGNSSRQRQLDEKGSGELEQHQTRGENLAEVDTKSFAYTEKMLPGNQEGTLFFDEPSHVKDDAFAAEARQPPAASPRLEADPGVIEEDEDIQPHQTIDVQPDQRKMILDSWNQVKTIGIDPVGRLLMRTIFDLEPAALNLYSFKDVPNLYESDDLRRHYTKLISALDNVIQAFINGQDVSMKLRELGKRHINYQVQKEHYNIVGRALLVTLDQGLGDRFTSEVKQAWVRMIMQISALMISDNYEENHIDVENVESANSKQRSALSPPVVPNQTIEAESTGQPQGTPGMEVPPTDASSSFNEMSRDMSQKELASGLQTLTVAKMRILQKAWARLSKVEGLGTKIFLNLFDIAPDSLDYFSFRNSTNLENSTQLHAHGRKVVTFIQTAMSQIENLKSVVPLFADLGINHKPFKVGQYQFELLNAAILFTFEEVLLEDYTEEFRDSWNIAFSIFKNIMMNKLTQEEVDQLVEDPAKRQLILERVDSETQNVDEDNDKRANSSKGFLDKLENLDSEEEIEMKREATLLERMSSHQGGMQSQKTSAKTQEQMMRTTLQISKEVKEHYAKKFKVEVDFHHKIQYRFEKVYRLSKKMPEKRRTLNLEIIDCICDFSGYIEHDPMSLFYCLFFCIYYENPDLVDFLRSLIQKVEAEPRIDRLLEYIDVHGVARLRHVGEQINALVYHMVFYQAVDDNLRIVYSQIFRKLKFIQLRDKDAIQLLNQRDYELIRMSFEKYTTKISLLNFYPKTFPLKASTYRKYNQAYFEEIVINNEIEERVARNYRERFLVTAEDIYIVFEMYCKEDYDEQFQSTQKDEITHKQFLDLFILCVRNDSFKIALLIYTLYLNTAEDMDGRMLDIIMASVKDSVKFHEIKLFFIHQHFSILSVSQMNQLVDIYQEVTRRKDPRQNPMLSQFNTIKITLLIYRICFKIEERQIYSLITKCSVLQNYLLSSLCLYFKQQNNILILYRFMSEPILHMTERKDSLDIMYEMNMQELLQHPVVVEVLNLVYEGKYSVSSSALSMNMTFNALLEMDTMNLKCVVTRLAQNIQKFGDHDSTKQSSLQFNVWKQSIQQRERDEMIFQVIVNGLIMFLAYLIILINNVSYSAAYQAFGENYFERKALLINAVGDQVSKFCESEVETLLDERRVLTFLTFLIVLNSLGVFTTIVQKLLIFRFKDNVKLNYVGLIFEFSIIVTGALYLAKMLDGDYNTIISDKCQDYLELSDSDKDSINLVHTLRDPYEGTIDFKMVLSVIVIQATLTTIQMLQRTRYLGELILTLQQLLDEIIRFFSTFGIIILFSIFVLQMLAADIQGQDTTIYQATLDIFEAFIGIINYERFPDSNGQAYIASFMFIFKVLLSSLLAAMFINKYNSVYQNIEAHKRFNIIRMKNSESYDKYVGGATLSFFPVNIVILPFLLPIMMIRSPRLSEFALKIQYTLMLFLYCLLILVFIAPSIALLQLKCIANAAHIFFNKVREDYKGQRIIQLAIAIFLGPLIIIVSFIVDFFSLPNVLMKSSRRFEHKYQLSSDKLSSEQTVTVTNTLKLIFNNYDQKYKGVSMTLLDLMIMHVKVFELIENLHNLTCIGSKDSKEALSNVQDYNMTKILTEKCSIPDRNGVYKLAKCNIDIIYFVSRDIKIYNYIDIVLKKLRLGMLREEIRQKENSTSSVSDDLKKASTKKEIAIKKAKELKKKNKRQENSDGEGSEEEVGLSAFPTEIGPDGVPLKRNWYDVMNNFFIDMVARSFTDIDTTAQREKNLIDQARAKKFENELNSKRDAWRDLTSGQFQRMSGRYEEYIRKKLYTYKLDIIKKSKERTLLPKASGDSVGMMKGQKRRQDDRTQSTGSVDKMDFSTKN